MTESEIVGLSPLTLRELQGMNGMRIVDCRSAGQRRRYPMPGAQPLDEIEAAAGKIASETVLIFVCQDGAWSRDAARRFAARGFESVFVLEGGVEAWTQTEPKARAA